MENATINDDLIEKEEVISFHSSYRDKPMKIKETFSAENVLSKEVSKIKEWTTNKTLWNALEIPGHPVLNKSRPKVKEVFLFMD